MEPDRPRDGISGTTERSPDRTTAGEGDFAWPPTAADFDRCGIVSLTGDAADEARLRVLVRLPDVLPPDHSVAASATPRTAARPAPVRAGRHERHWGVEQPAAAYPFHVDGDDPMATASAGGEVRRALVAVAAGISLAVLSYVQFRSARADATALMNAVTGTTADTVDRHGPDPVMDAPERSDNLASTTESLQRRLIERAAKVTATDAPAGTKLTRLAADVVDEVRGPAVAEAASVRAGTLDAAPPVDTIAEAEPRPTAAVIEDRAAPAPGPPPPPIAMTAAVRVDPLPVEPVRRDEDHIRAALTQWRTAYSSLDAGAARAVWPSVDARALERAFQDLKSQDLRFDRCELTVNGGSAQAACSGRAVYVPRFGNQSPKTAPREWTFELEKRDERWTIASARAS